MNDANINVNVNADTKTKKRKLEKDYKKFGLTARDILNLTDFKILLDDVNTILKNKLNEIREKKEKNKNVEENQNQ